MVRFKIEESKANFRQFCLTVKPTSILAYTEKFFIFRSHASGTITIFVAFL